jgi:hypothetical protein
MDGHGYYSVYIRLPARAHPECRTASLDLELRFRHWARMQNNSHGKKRTENTEKSNNNAFYAEYCEH